MKLTITRPDDWHIHFRDGDALNLTVPHTAETMARAIVMPNLKPPVTTTALAQEYFERIVARRPEGRDFTPLMTLYLTDKTTSDEIHRAADSGIVHGVKVYPAGATTNSDSGVTNFDIIVPTLKKMAEVGMLLLVRGMRSALAAMLRQLTQENPLLHANQLHRRGGVVRYVPLPAYLAPSHWTERSCGPAVTAPGRAGVWWCFSEAISSGPCCSRPGSVIATSPMPNGWPVGPGGTIASPPCRSRSASSCPHGTGIAAGWWEI